MHRTITVLTRARTLIADPQHWTQGAAARAADRSIVFVDSPRAVCWCAEGAVMHFMTPEELRQHTTDLYGEVFAELSTASRWVYDTYASVTHEGITAINDKEGHAMTLAMFDRAIETATEKYATDDDN